MTDRRRVLVTTGYPCTWYEDDDVLMLGPWCRTVPEEATGGPQPAPRHCEIAEFHWDDRKKLARDYDYLHDLHSKLLGVLATSLNQYHGRSCSRRYWQLLLDPWLMAYIGVEFDRWESLRQAFVGGEDFDTEMADGGAVDKAPFSYMAFIDCVLSDDWNFRLFNRLLSHQYRERCYFREERRRSAQPVDTNWRAGSQRRRGPFAVAAAWIDAVLALFSARNRVVFLNSYFSPSALVRLSLKMRVVPRLYWKEFPSIESPRDLGAEDVAQDRRSVSLGFQPANDFERYLGAYLPQDLPTCVVEHYHALSARASSIGLRPALIVTANAHFSNVLAKAWMAESVEAGARLVVLEHGGSFPARRELFDFEEDVSDVRGTWFKPYHFKHVQVPPSKLVGKFVGDGSLSTPGEHASYCLVVGNESPRWPFRAHFYPMADQCKRSLQLVSEMIAGLHGPVAKAVRIRPAPNQGWNLADEYSRRFGPQVLLQGGTLMSAFRHARLIVCTYPETTFSEAMATGRPVVLLYPPEVYERHPVASQLLDQMRKARIIFHDAGAATSHIAAVWQDPGSWWRTREVRSARDAFFETALRLRGDWLSEWEDFLERCMQAEGPQHLRADLQ